MDMLYGMCRSTDGTLAIWRELVDGRYELEWGRSDSPHVLDIQTMSIINDGTRLIGKDKNGYIIKALKMKLKREHRVELPEDPIYSDDFELSKKKKMIEDLKEEMKKFK